MQRLLVKASADDHTHGRPGTVRMLNQLDEGSTCHG